MAAYTIKAGDTFSAIASSLNVDVGVILSLNPGVEPTQLQVGQVINIPSNGSSQPPQPPPTYTIVAGDTFTSIASRYGTDVATIQNLNPGVQPTTLQIGQVINVPRGATQTPITPTVPQSGGIGGPLVEYSGPASNFPSPSQWAPYDALWARNSTLMNFSNTPAEIAMIGRAIPQISNDYGLDARVILCMCMQETGGNVRAPTTLSPAPDFVRNTGIMQAHDGAVFNPGDPEGSVWQMIRDGAGGTRSGDGLLQCLQKFGGNYYEALRAYNSGTVDRANLSNGITATGHYVSRMANRLCGHIWDGM